MQADQLLRQRSYPIDVIAVPPKVHPHVAAIGPTQVRKRLRERREARLPHGIVFVARHEHADAPHAVALLRPRRERPNRRRAAEPCDELPSLHWITSSAVANSVSGMVRPSALAVLRLMISWISRRLHRQVGGLLASGCGQVERRTAEQLGTVIAVGSSGRRA